MDTRPPPTLEESLDAAQSWWRGAGVDFAFHDEPIAWLADEAPPAADAPAAAAREQTVAAQRPAMGGEPSSWPRDLAAFRDWWLAEPGLDEGGLHPRLAPRGQANAPLMMLVPMPEAEDRDNLLSAGHGRLLASLTRAMGLAPEQVYFAAALPRHSAMPDWERLATDGLGGILRHHIALANPARLMVFGNRISSLLGHDPAQGSPAVSEMDIDGRHMPVLATFAPERLLGSARQRAGLWQRWLEWTERDA